VSERPLHILHLLYEPHPSGISRHVREVVRALPDLRHSVILPRQLVGVAEDLRQAGAVAIKVPMRSRLLPSTALHVIPRLIRGADPDVVHLHALETGAFGTLAALLGGARRLVFTPQTTEIRLRQLLPIYEALLRAAGLRIDAWIAVSRGQARHLGRLARAGTVHLVPNAAPGDRSLPERSEARRRLGWPAERPVVVCVARLAVQKDPLTFARAAQGANGALWVLVGDGPLRSEVEALARTTPALRIQGHWDPIEDVYAAADVLCLPSRWEGLSLALLSAMAHGLPVVASRIEGNVDVVQDGETGLLVEPGDAAALRAAAMGLLSDPQRARRLAVAARARVQRDHSMGAIGERLRAIYQGEARS